MKVFKFPKVRGGINSVLVKYWWGQTRNEKKIHWMNWNRLCTPKNKGGMGFRDIHAFNHAMLAKQAWSLATSTHSLFYRVYKARYFTRCSFLEAELGWNPSFVWCSLLSTRDLILEGSIWPIGNRQSIKISNNRWLPCSPIFKLGVDTTMKVEDLIDHQPKQWNISLIQATFTPPHKIFWASNSVTFRHGMGYTGKRIRPNGSRSELPIKSHFAWTKWYGRAFPSSGWQTALEQTVETVYTTEGP